MLKSQNSYQPWEGIWIYNAPIMVSINFIIKIAYISQAQEQTKMNNN